MRNVLAAATLLVATLTTACTAHHRVAPGRPLPEDSTSHLRGALQGAGIGVLAGATTGALLGYSAGDDEPCGEQEPFLCLRFTAKEKAVFGAFYGGLPSAAVGLVVGAVVGSRDVYEYDAVPQIKATVGSDHVGASASWRF